MCNSIKFSPELKARQAKACMLSLSCALAEREKCPFPLL
jgi:hypothetical protein